MLAQRSDQFRQPCHISYRLWYPGTVEIRAEAYAVDTEMLDKIVYMTHQDIERGVRVIMPIITQVIDSEVKSHHAFGFFDGIQLLIRQVACRWAKGVRIEWVATSGASDISVTS